MRIKENFNLEKLVDYGFEITDKEQENEESEIFYSDYKLNLGHSRRGQFYWILVNSGSRNLSIVATMPDGDGGAIRIPNILMRMVEEGIVEYS